MPFRDTPPPDPEPLEGPPDIAPGDPEAELPVGSSDPRGSGLSLKFDPIVDPEEELGGMESELSGGAELEEGPPGTSEASAGPVRAAGPRWQEPEIAWPLAMVAGFAGAAIGIATTVPLLGCLLAAGLAAALILPLLDRGQRGVAALCAVGWAIGVGGAVVGSILEVGFDRVVGAIPGVEWWIAAEVSGFAKANGHVFPAEKTLMVSVVAVVLLALLARPFRGLLAFPVLAWVVSVISGGIGWFAQAAVRAGKEDLAAVAAGTPPHALLALVGALLLSVATAEPGPFLPISHAPSGRRSLLWTGLALAALGWVVHVTLRTTWGESLAPWLR